MRVEIEVIRKQKLFFHQLSVRENIFRRRQGNEWQKEKEARKWQRGKEHITFFKEESLDVLRQFIPNVHGQHKTNVWEKTKWRWKKYIHFCPLATQAVLSGHSSTWSAKLMVSWSVKDRRAQTLDPERLPCWTEAKVTWRSALGLLVCALCVYVLHTKLYGFNIQLSPNTANFHRRRKERGKEQEKRRQTDSTSGLSSIGSRETRAGSAGGHLTGPPLLPHIFSLRLHSKTERQEEGWRKWLHLVWFWRLSTGRSASVH